MRVSSINASSVSGTLRFDAKHHLGRLNPLLQTLRSGRWELRSIAETFGRENVWTGNIFSRVYASSASFGKPLLVPYDLFRYLPWSDKILSRSQVDQFSDLEIQRGWLFLVCSGRNLGPVTIADSFCTQFAMSHDMVRIAVKPSPDLFYLAAFLSTAYGQAAIRTDMNGSVIDHTDANQVAALRYPIVEAKIQQRVATLFQAAFEKRERARLLLATTQKAYLRHAPHRYREGRACKAPRGAGILSRAADQALGRVFSDRMRRRVRAHRVSHSPVEQVRDSCRTPQRRERASPNPQPRQAF